VNGHPVRWPDRFLSPYISGRSLIVTVSLAFDSVCGTAYGASCGLPTVASPRDAYFLMGYAVRRSCVGPSEPGRLAPLLNRCQRDALPPKSSSPTNSAPSASRCDARPVTCACLPPDQPAPHGSTSRFARPHTTKIRDAPLACIPDPVPGGDDLAASVCSALRYAPARPDAGQ
jgi:hypothetical protein